jgi:hypothetical protein
VPEADAGAVRGAGGGGVAAAPDRSGEADVEIPEGLPEEPLPRRATGVPKNRAAILGLV